MKEILEISHLIYKVKDLTDAVKKFNDLGFTVEYGDEKKQTQLFISLIELISR